MAFRTVISQLGWSPLYGLAARGVVFIITGMFFLYVAFTVDPGQAGGIPQALSWVRQLPFGAVLYAIAAVGLLAFGIYGFVEAPTDASGRPP